MMIGHGQSQCDGSWCTEFQGSFIVGFNRGRIWGWCSLPIHKLIILYRWDLGPGQRDSGSAIILKNRTVPPKTQPV